MALPAFIAAGVRALTKGGLGAAAKTTLKTMLAKAGAEEAMTWGRQSSAIAGISYNPLTGTLSISFTNKAQYGTYHYPDVPMVEAAKFIAASSKGKHFHSHIKQYG